MQTNKVAPARLRIEVTRYDPKDFGDDQDGIWFRRRFICRCGCLIKEEDCKTLETGKDHCFQSETVLRNNRIPRYCPECGEKIKREDMKVEKITKEQFEEMKNASSPKELALLLEEYAGIETRPYTAYQYFDAAGNFVGDSDNYTLLEILKSAGVDIE